jgi:hypothetical protein
MVLALIKLIFIIKTQGAAYLGRGGAADGRRRLALAAGSVRKGRRCSGLEEVTVRDWGDAARRGGALGLVGFDCGGLSGGIVWRQCSGHGRRRTAGDGALVVFRQRGGAADVQIGVANIMVASSSSPGVPRGESAATSSSLTDGGDVRFRRCRAA